MNLSNWNKHLALLALLVSLISQSGCVIVERSQKNFGQLQEEQSFRDYTVRVFRDEDDGNGCFEILRGQRRVYFQSGYMFRIGDMPYADKTNNLIQMGRCITGQGKPNLVVAEWTGGAHCCYVFYIFEIGDKFKEIEIINARDSCDPEFRDLRGDGNLEIAMNDYTFAYWNACFAASPAPDVILRFNKSKYRLDQELMRKPVPSEDEFANLAANFKKEFEDGTYLDGVDDWKAPPDMWGKMLDLIYSGNRASAWRVLDMAWPADWPNKDKFKKDFKEELAESPYYSDIIELNSPRTKRY